MSRIILPNEAPKGAQPLFVPRGYEAPEILGYCLVPGCEREGKPFTSGQEDAWQRHVGWCARRHLDEIGQASEDNKARRAIFDPNSWDPEVKEHMQKVGKKMLEEGRLIVKPNERAGF